MALKKSMETGIGLTANGAYHRVEAIQINKKQFTQIENQDQSVESHTITFRLRSYVKADGVPAFSDRHFLCVYNINVKNPFIQAYEHVKSLDEFKDAEDC